MARTLLVKTSNPNENDIGFVNWTVDAAQRASMVEDGETRL